MDKQDALTTLVLWALMALLVLLIFSFTIFPMIHSETEGGIRAAARATGVYIHELVRAPYDLAHGVVYGE